MANPPLWQLPDPPASSPAGRVPSSMRPAAIRRAVLFMYAGAALSVAYGVVEGITAHTSPTNRAAYNAGEVLGGIIVGLVQCALWLWMAAKNGTGRGWALILPSVVEDVVIGPLTQRAFRSSADDRVTFLLLAQKKSNPKKMAFRARARSIPLG